MVSGLQVCRGNINWIKNLEWALSTARIPGPQNSWYPWADSTEYLAFRKEVNERAERFKDQRAYGNR